MENNTPSNLNTFKRDIFRTGEYIQYFRPEDTKNPFNKIYEKKKQDTLNIVNQSNNPKVILDVGGGMGRLSISLAQSDNINNVVLMDLSLQMLKLAIDQSEQLSNLAYVQANGQFLPFADQSFDYIVALDLLCHLDRPKIALGEFQRVLKDDGILILDSTNGNPLWVFCYPRYVGKNPVTLFKILKYHGVYPGWEKIVKHYSKKQFIMLLTEMGFSIKRHLNYGPFFCPKWHLTVSQKKI